MKFLRKRHSGISLVEVLIVIGIASTIFVALFASVQYSLQLIAHSNAKLSALSLANDRLEYFRSLPYDDVGTIAGIPSGTIPQNSTTTLNGIEFNERVLVEYVDDAADGKLTATTTDSNGIPSDYKRLKIEISWTIKGETNDVTLVSNIVPRSIETTIGGGTVRVNVVNDQSLFLPGAEVRLLNNTTTSTIDITRYTDGSGSALFSGAPAASGYQVFVTAPGYSTDQTYEATTTNPNPITAPFAVLESDISTVTFQVGELSDIYVRSLSAIASASTTEDFNNSSGIATSTDIEVIGGNLELSNTLGVYETTGTAYLNEIRPATIDRWESVVVVGDAFPNTSYTVQFFTGTTSSYTLIGDGDLDGNAVGFTEQIIDLSELNPNTHPAITVGITLNTTDTDETPSVYEISTYYRESDASRNNVNFDIVGNKTIGTQLDLSPIYKVSFSTTTDTNGERWLNDIEFDTYTVSNTDGFGVAYACPQIPLVHSAGSTSTLEMVLVSPVAHSLRVTVRDGFGRAIPGAIVSLTRSGFSDNDITDACGQSYFDSGVTANTDYIINVTRNGYAPETVNPYDITGETSTVVVMTES
tara:strand:- start:13079 stop:14836 length:1758 start_codon:yes stop_codon:yes gene_type:complete